MISNRQMSILKSIVMRPVLQQEIEKAISYTESVTGIEINENCPDMIIEKMARRIKEGPSCKRK